MKAQDKLTYGPVHPWLVIVTNPDGEGGGYDVYSAETREQADAAAREIREEKMTWEAQYHARWPGHTFRSCEITVAQVRADFSTKECGQ